MNTHGVTTRDGGRSRDNAEDIFHPRGGRRIGFALFFLLLTPPRVGFCESTPSGTSDTSDSSNDAVWRAFEAGLGKYSSGKSPLLLEINRYGAHWSLTGYDRTGASVRQLTCLLCTHEEAAAAAAYLGDTLGREYRSEPPAQTTITVDDTTLSLDGVPVPPVRAEQKQPFLKPVPADAAIRTRTAVVCAGLGISAFVIGGIFLSMDQVCANAECSRLYPLKPAGIAVIVSGAVLETAAILVWRLKRNRGAGE